MSRSTGQAGKPNSYFASPEWGTSRSPLIAVPLMPQSLPRPCSRSASPLRGFRLQQVFPLSRAVHDPDDLCSILNQTIKNKVVSNWKGSQIWPYIRSVNAHLRHITKSLAAKTDIVLPALGSQRAIFGDGENNRLDVGLGPWSKPITHSAPFSALRASSFRLIRTKASSPSTGSPLAIPTSHKRPSSSIALAR